MTPVELALYLWKIYRKGHPHPKGAPIIRDSRGRPNFILALNLAKALHSYAKALGIDPAMIDPMELDSNMSYEEAINYIRSRIPKKDEERFDPLRYAFWTLESLSSREPLSAITPQELEEYREALSIIRKHQGLGLRPRRRRIPPKNKIRTLDAFIPSKGKESPRPSRKYARRRLI